MEMFKVMKGTTLVSEIALALQSELFVIQSVRNELFRTKNLGNFTVRLKPK